MPLAAAKSQPVLWKRARGSDRIARGSIPRQVLSRGLHTMATEVRESVSEAVIPGTGFTKAHQLFRETVRRFVDTEINPHIDQWEEDEIFPAHELFKKAGDLGLLGLSYPEEYGGAAADYWYNM